MSIAIAVIVGITFLRLVVVLFRALIRILDDALLLGLRQEILRRADGVENGERRGCTTFDLHIDVKRGGGALVGA